MAILGEIRKRPMILMGIIALAMLAFVVNPDSLDKVFGQNPNVFGKVNGEEITRDEYNDQLSLLQNQAEQQGQPTKGLEEQAWQLLVQSKLIKQQFEKMGMKMTDELFWSQLPFDQLFAQDPNFKVNDFKKQIEALQTNGDIQQYNSWLKTRKSIEYRIMARQVFANISSGVTIGKKEAEGLLTLRDQKAIIDYVKVDYNAFAQKNPVKVTTEDIAAYIKKHAILFKRDASRNLGVVLFQAAPSAADDAAAKKEMDKLINIGSDNSGGKESFSNTTNDSLFVVTNSDVQAPVQYYSANQLPTQLRDKVATAGIRELLGPYKEGNFYVASKVLDKKPSDSTLSSHILIAYKGANRAETNRSKEQAKKTADSILAIVKADPAKFATELKLSDEPNAVERGGSVGWTTPESPFDPAYLHFLATNAKGNIGIQESSFGYHIIKIDDKKSGAMTYKVANLVKEIKSSEKTENDTYNKATKFIQQVQGKSFNDFSNLAKKNKYNFQNPKNVIRFQGTIPGVGTDKDEEVIAWAFNKDRKKGDTEIFTVEGTGDKIVAYVNGIQQAGTADPESVREQVEPIVKNELIAKKITEKMTGAKATSLDQIAKLFGATKATGEVNMLNPMLDNAMEPKVAGAAFGVANGKISNAVEGSTGVYVVQRKNIVTNKQPGDLKSFTEAVTGQTAQSFGQAFMKSLQDNADIEDFRNEVINKEQQ